MNWEAISFDWNQVRAFLATVEEGSLSGAARVLHQTQPTISRQILALEGHLGVTLFERGPRATSLTQAGIDLLEHVRVMADAAVRMSLAASGRSQAVEGLVSITATETIATYVLPSVLARLRELAPQIEIALVPSNDMRDLIKREADIAVRHARPEQGDLTARCVRSAEAHFYASRRYLARAGHPRNKGELLGAEFVGLRPMERSLASLHAQDLPLTPEQFRVTTASGTTLVELVRQGLGVGVLLDQIAQLFPEFFPILPEEISFPVPFWLVTHRELYTSRRIRLVYDLLAEALSEG